MGSRARLRVGCAASTRYVRHGRPVSAGPAHQARHAPGRRCHRDHASSPRRYACAHATQPEHPRARAHRAHRRRGDARPVGDGHGDPRSGDAPAARRPRPAARRERPDPLPASGRGGRHRERAVVVLAVRPRRHAARRHRGRPGPLHPGLVRPEDPGSPARARPGSRIRPTSSNTSASATASRTSRTSRRRSRRTTTSKRRSRTPGACS